MGLSLVTPPTDEPVTTDDVVQFGRIPLGSEEFILERAVAAARDRVEILTGRALLTQTWDWFLDRFPCASRMNPFGAMLVPKPPLQSVTSIKYIDPDGAEQTLGSSLYTVDAKSEPGRITPAYGESWPDIRYVPNAVTVTFVAGWATAEEIRPELRHLVMVRAKALYEQREAFLVGETIVEDPVFQRIAAEHRMYGLV